MWQRVVGAIRQSGLTIYDNLDARSELFLTNEQLQDALTAGLQGLNLDYPIRTRSKIVKQEVCKALGYPIPKSFQKTKPRFLGQDFDTYVQKSNNLQIWNEEISASRRYALIRVDESHVVTKVRVISGEVVAGYDPTGTLTSKFQAASRAPVTASTLVSPIDTASVQARLQAGRLLPIADLYRELLPLCGTTILNPGNVQERNRGAGLHMAVAQRLGLSHYGDTGQFPDIVPQLLEIKLQTSATIDLGLVSPDDRGRIADIPDFLHSDVRYAVFYGTLQGATVQLNHVVLSTGEAFFTFFRRFEGKVTNKKLQIPLPDSVFA